MSVGSSWRTDVSGYREMSFPHSSWSGGADGFYFQIYHAKTQEKELLAEKSYFFNNVFYYGGDVAL